MLQIRDYLPGDESGIRELFQRVFGSPMSQRHWSWKYQRSLQEGAAPILAVDDAGRTYGHAGAVYLKGCSGQRRIPFLQICDVMVDPAVRGHLGDKNLYTRMIRQFFDRLATDFPDAFAYGFPGTRPFKLGKYAGVYECIEQAHEITLAAHRPAPWLLVRPAPLVGPKLDPLWSRFEGHFSLSLDRNRDYLEWRYQDNPTCEYRRVNLFYWRRHAGWVVYRPLADKTLIVDLLSQPQHVPRYLSAVAHWLESRGEPPAVVWLPGRLGNKVSGTSTEMDVVTTNMVRGFRTPTSEAWDKLYYTMGDVDIF